MAQDFATAFYHSSKWKKLQRQIKGRAYGLCEICGKPGLIVHHKVVLTPDNINDPVISLNPDLLMYVCFDCHNRIHGDKGEQREAIFDADGNLVELDTTDYSQYIIKEGDTPLCALK